MIMPSTCERAEMTGLADQDLLQMSASERA
jgi:hypothetical protein